MEIQCIWEHNGGDSLLYAGNLPGAYARGASRDEAMDKMAAQAAAYLAWKGGPAPRGLRPVVVQEKASGLAVSDADSDVLFDTERAPLTPAEYEPLKELALRSAADFLALYEAVPDKDKSCLPARVSFYGPVPRTAREMYEHTKNVNSYYFGEIGVEVGNEGSILEGRRRGFALLERQPGYLAAPARTGSFGEEWSLRKLLRRFIWHDRIHAKAMWRMAQKTFGAPIANPFCFER